MWFGSFSTIIRLNDVGVTGSYTSFTSEILGAENPEIRKVAKIDCFRLFRHLFQLFITFCAPELDRKDSNRPGHPRDTRSDIPTFRL